MANSQIPDCLDDGNLGSNPNGTGSGFTSRGQSGIGESGGRGHDVPVISQDGHDTQRRNLIAINEKAV